MSELQQTLSGLMTGLLLLLFIGICIWSWSGKRKEGFDRMANLPLEDSTIDKNTMSSGNNMQDREDNKREVSA